MKQEEQGLPELDRMGIYIRNLRRYLGIPRWKLAEGLCSESQLARIESGEREGEKLLLDALLERIGRAAGLFERILDQEEEEGYWRRQQIIYLIRKKKLVSAKKGIKQYRHYIKRQSKERRFYRGSTLEEQFLKIMEINLGYLEGSSGEQLSKWLREALCMTQPHFGKVPLSELLLGRNEVYLILALLRLKKKGKQPSFFADSLDEAKLLDYIRVHFKDSQERVYVLPYAAYQAARWAYEKGELQTALEDCREARALLQKEQQSFCREQLLELEQRIRYEIGSQEELPGKLWREFRRLRRYVGVPEPMWLPYEENHDNAGGNEVLRSRRRMLRLSQEEMTENPGDPSIWRYEKKGVRPQRGNRRKLLQQVGLSGERYDYEIISTDHEDYLLRSRLGRAVNQGKWELAEALLEELRGRIPDTKQNRQYLEVEEATLAEHLPEENPKKISIEERILRLQKALAMTLPGLPIEVSEVKKLSEHPAGMVSLNESIILQQIASCYKRQGKLQESLEVLRFLKRCLEFNGKEQVRDIDQYTLCTVTLVSVLGDCGYYQESNQLGKECIRWMLERETNARMADCLFSIAWNREQQRLEEPERYSGEKGKKQKKRCLAFFRMAYAAAIWSQDINWQEHLKKYCIEICGVELTL